MVPTALWECPVPVSPEGAKAPARGPTLTTTCGSSADSPVLSLMICGVTNKQRLRSTRRAEQGSEHPGLEDFVVAAARQRDRSNQRETIEQPLDRVERGHHPRFASVAQQRDVRQESFRIEANV